MNKTFTRKTINGRQFHFLAIPGADLFKFEIVNMIGANIERAVEQVKDKNIYGLSHFIEHLGFRAPKDYTTDQLMKLVKTEGTYNASTDHDRINYWFKTTSDRASTAIRLVCNYALNDLKNIDDEEFQTEKKVVYNEAKRYADDDQTMFHFNTTPAMCGYHVEDNVIGIPETIDTFTIEDAIETKEIFLKYGKMFINVMYDPEVLNEDDIASMVNAEMDRFDLPEKEFTSDFSWLDKHNELLAYPTTENVLIENESEQAMTCLTLDVVEDDIVTARLGNAFLSRYADTSLTDIIREKNGLTYGVQFGDGNVSFKPYTYFMCDVTRGDEGKLLELFKESINLSVDNFDEETYNKLMKVHKLKRTMQYVNLQNYESLHWTAIWHPHIFDKYEAEFADNIATVFEKYDTDECTYENVKAYLLRVQDVVNSDNYGKASNV